MQRLQTILDILFSEKGCIWAKDQTLKSLCPIFLEEVHELIEAIDTEDPKQICEELGDFLYNAHLLVHVAEKMGFTTQVQLIEDLCNKIERRHVHVFGDHPVATMEELGELYEGIKRQENKGRACITDGIPKTLGALARAQKVLDRISRIEGLPEKDPFQSEAELEGALVELLLKAHHGGLDPETQLHRLIGRLGDRFFVSKVT